MDLMVTTNQKPIIDAQMKQRKESKHNTKDSHQILRERSKRRRTTKNYKNNQKTSNKMAMCLKLQRFKVKPDTGLVA